MPDLERSVWRLEAQMENLTVTIAELKGAVENLDRLANRWKGGFAAILMLGAIGGFVIEQVVRFIFNK